MPQSLYFFIIFTNYGFRFIIYFKAMKNKKINLASLKKSLQLFFLSFNVFSSTLFAQTGHWEKLNPPVSPSVRQEFGMASIGYRKALLFGGYGHFANGFRGYLGDTWLFDYETKTWSELESKVSPKNRSDHQMCQLSENFVLLFGGSNSEWEYFDDTWIFDLTDTSWTKLTLNNFPSARSNFGMSRISENKALLFGGRDYNIDTQYDTWIFDFDEKSWNVVPTEGDDWTNSVRPYFRTGPMITQIEDKKVILFGGWYAGKFFNDTWHFDLDSMKWKKILAFGMSDSLKGGGICNISNSKILVFGGSNAFLRDNSWMFNFTNLTWSLFDLNTKPPARMSTGLAKLEDGKALLFGGFTNEAPVGDTWLFTTDINGVEEGKNISNTFQISPNPAGDFIEISVGAQCTVPNIRIYNVFGETVSTSVCSADTSASGGQRIDVSGLPSGVYFVRMGGKVWKFLKM